ncbi:MAG: substrate-binding domain-containing protein [Xanthobacteraceae bacterium]
MRFGPSPSPRFAFAAGLVLCMPASTACADDGLVRIGGTGMALAAMQQLGESLTAADRQIRVEVLPSLGTPGGLRALREGAIDVAVAGRPLKPDERAKGFVEAGCMTTALTFASSHPNPAGLRKADLPAIYADESPLWPDGQPLKLLLRSRAGSENAYLSAAIPGMAAAIEKAYTHSGVPVATTDQENADLAQRTAGSLAIMTLLQLRSERLDLRPVSLDGVTASAATLVDKSYPMTARICAVLPAAPKPAAVKFAAHMKSADGSAMIESMGATPSD